MRPRRRIDMGLVNVCVEFFPSGKRKNVSIEKGADGLRLVRSLEMAPDTLILIRGETPIPLGEELKNGDTVRIISVASGG